jgi:hypothetical protein
MFLFSSLSRPSDTHPCLLILQILKGSFGDSGDDTETNPKKRKRRLRVLNSLASSVLPLLCESALWNLQTQDLARFHVSTKTHALVSPSTHFLQANTCMVVLTIELISSFFVLLQEGCGKFRPLLVTSLAEKVNQLNSALVQNAAHQCMHTLARMTCGPDSDVSRLVSECLSSLVASMMGRLRLPGGIKAPKDGEFDENVVRVAVSLRWALEIVQKSNLGGADSHSHQAASATMMDLMTLIIARVDHFNLNKQLSDTSVLEFNFLYQSSLEYLLVYWGASSDEVYTYQMQSHEQEPVQPWLDLLAPYRKASFGSGSNPIGNNHDESCRDQSSSPETNLADGTEGQPVLTMSEINFASLVISRSCLFLSHQNLNVKIAACNSLTSGFRLLAFVSCRYIVSGYILFLLELNFAIF